MARKAVQGFPEKSYYDNTRYLGIVATTDPLNEGLFKHMVNFDISDTGQSVQPREGFLTTRLNNVTLSNNTIIYKDNTLGDYILFDMAANKAYIADISGYNVENYILPIELEIANIEWDELFKQVLIPQVSYVAAYKSTTTLASTITEFKNKIKVIEDTKIEHIYDENGISRTLVKVRLVVTGQTDFNFIIQLRYRQNAIGLLPANTLIVEGLPYMFEHPTLAPTERNIAVSKSIIPETFQRLYTKPLNVDPNSVDPRPDGHISNLGTFIYVYDDVNNYVNNFIYRNTNYNIKPYFTLNPAYIDLNNLPEATDKWAYKFEVFNTSIENISDSPLETVYSSPWMKYINNTTKPERVFSGPSEKVNTFVLGNSDITLNHYRNARYVIYVVPKAPNSSTSTTSSFQDGEYVVDYPNYPAGPQIGTYNSLKTSWTNIINSIKDVSTFKTNIGLLTDVLFYVVDLSTSSPQNIFNESYDTLENFYKAYHTIDKPNANNDGYEDLFLTNAELLKLLDDKQLTFKNQSIAFKLLPFVTNERITIQDRDDVSTIRFRWFFGSILDNVTTFTSDILFNEQQLHRSSTSTPISFAPNKTRTQHTTNIFQNNYLNFNCASGAESDHKIIVTSNNKVYAFGRNENGQLGFGNTTNNYKTPTLNTNNNLLLIPNTSFYKNFIGVATGSSHTYLLTETSLISFGSNTNGRLGINSTNTGNFSTPQVTDLTGLENDFIARAISSGSAHGVLLSSTGKVWTWGAGTLGQIGNNLTTSNNITFVPITSQFSLSPGEVIKYITSGKNHNFALTSFGTLYGWGHNSSGQVGIGGTSNVLTPQIINFVGLKANEVIVNVSAGSNHSIALTNLGRVYVWGSNAHDQLGGVTSASSIGVPTLLPLNFLDIDEKVNKVFTGSDQTYLISDKKNIYGFGQSWLGFKASRTDTETPTLINFPGLLTDEEIVGFYNSEADSNFSTATSSNLAFTNLNRIFVWGYDGSWGALGKNTDSATADDQPAIPTTLTIPLDENESIKRFEVGFNWTRIKQNATSLISTSDVNTRYFDLRTWNLYEGSTSTNTFVPYISTFREQFSLYVVRHNNFFVNNNYGFFKYNVLNGTYTLETNLNILNNIGKAPVSFNDNSIFSTNNQPPIYAATINDLPSNAAVGTRVQVIGSTGTGNGTVYTRQSDNTWLAGSINGATNPGVSFIKNQTYYGTNAASKRLYIWENESGTTGMLTEISLLGYPEVFANLNSTGFFNKGLIVNFYMRPYEESELLNKTQTELETLEVAWGASSFIQTTNLSYGFDNLTVTYIDEVLDTYPEQIQTSNSLSIFEDSRLLVWNKNVLFISEEGRFYWFKERNRIEFGEEIVKVLQYKQLILVFTTQHLYAIYRVETTTTQLNTSTNQIEQNVTGVAWVKQIVLYNLLVSKKYADVIQIFNQMVLFYSEDGQLFMIRPSNTIDDQTRFNIQFFNKSANDILEHYDEYINERLAAYAKDTRITKDQVQIKALVSINFIKIIYYVPGVITYMLVYDVINNRYFAYDSLTFTNIFDKRFIESGDLFITEHNNNLYFTFLFKEPNIRDNYADMTFTNNFKKENINCLIDTGNLNLNNHIHKRFRDLHVTFKNLNAGDVLFNLETMIDEIIVRPFYSEHLEVQETGGAMYLVSVPKFNSNDIVDINNISETATDVIKYSLTNNLFETNNVLMDFSQYTSSKLLTHRTSILGLGKVFRIKLQFISKGLYKLQNFGIIYKERRV